MSSGRGSVAAELRDACLIGFDSRRPGFQRLPRQSPNFVRSARGTGDGAALVFRSNAQVLLGDCFKSRPDLAHALVVPFDHDQRRAEQGQSRSSVWTVCLEQRLDVSMTGWSEILIEGPVPSLASARANARKIRCLFCLCLVVLDLRAEKPLRVPIRHRPGAFRAAAQQEFRGISSDSVVSAIIEDP